MEQALNLSSRRAKQARTGVWLGGTASQVSLYIAIVTVILGGVTLIMLGSSIGWAVAGLSGPLWMVLRYGIFIRTVPPAKGGVDALLDPYILARITDTTTPKQLTDIVAKTHGGTFFGARFLIYFELVRDGVPDNATEMSRVWQLAEELRLRHGFDELNGAVIIVALLHMTEGIDGYLAHLGLDKTDLDKGLEWYMHIEAVIAEHAKRRPKGGIGRDWAFGYTPLLERLGLNISEHITYGGDLNRDLPSRDQLVRHITQTLSQGGRRNIALVGQLGSGKTKLIYNLAEKLLEADPSVPKELHFHQVVALDPATLMARARGRGELEELVQRLCYEALRAKNVILFLDDAQLFFEEGTGSVDLTNILLPVLDGGALRLILAMDEQRWTRISQQNPALTQHMNRVMVPPADEAETMLILENQLFMYEHQHKVNYTYQALQAAYRLSARFMSEQAMPGKALKLLEAAGGYADQKLVTKQSVEQAIEQTQGVKVGTADTSQERDTLLNLEALIHERMINQSRAVKVVSDALRRARAGVRNTTRPIGTFLFLGPTGVGKTELAKSVAAVFFKNEENLIRLDLNEYVRSEDVSRLIADAAQDQHSLTAQIARQPFSVVLLDEIEKAHPEVLNTLLQVLDEGILRDINNREVSFRDAVIIATSNAGADRIREHIEAGEQLEQFEQQFTDELVSSNTFRPEFLNRFDDIVLFRPLNTDELLQVIDLILRGVNKTLADQKLVVAVDEDAKRLLVEAGYDPRLGARPMRRIVQRTVENIVANQVLAQQAMPGSTIQVSKDMVAQMLGQSASTTAQQPPAEPPAVS